MPRDAALVGRRIDGRYTLVRAIGHVARGAVFEARNDLGRRFALKVIVAESDGQRLDVADLSDRIARRTLREARAAARLDHPNVAQVLDFGIDASLGAAWILMELLEGRDLRDVLRQTGALPPPNAARILADAARGLAHAHAAGVVHRDVKPANIFLATRAMKSS